MAELTFFEKFLDIQERLSVPKLKQNDFAGFVYRSVEDIEIALKPLLKEHKLGFYFTDQMIEVGGRVYCEATAHLIDGSVSPFSEITGKASAQEAPEPKKKTDHAQLTGGVSSYARKYAAQGLFLIDDGKDDPDNPKVVEATVEGLGELSKAKAKLFAAFKKAGITDTMDMMSTIQQATGKDSVDNLEDAQRTLRFLEEDNE